jgi:hypothetical protein
MVELIFPIQNGEFILNLEDRLERVLSQSYGRKSAD